MKQFALFSMLLGALFFASSSFAGFTGVASPAAPCSKQIFAKADIRAAADASRQSQHTISLRTDIVKAAWRVEGMIDSFEEFLVEHGGGTNSCGCHVKHSTGECHCHKNQGCGCSCQPASCPPR